ncbi:hypothetical protein GJ744_011397 [Endocarpon pusillum]|uniref:YMC020W-like alpha/beta hydrolase domain-containing protein n=1 Tax=Endocarpon pusillum TaxID=364733 RepID=A0A8H7E2Z1_9EURO|nr:hypothetical protein GJ744_011397 [Endocarpon pusillum]
MALNDSQELSTNLDGAQDSISLEVPSQTRSIATPETSGVANSPEKTKRSSWYNRTWPRKTAPITQGARESISSASNTASEVLSSVKRPTKPKTKRTPSLQLTLGKATSSRSPPADATTTRVNATSRGSISSPTTSKPNTVVEEQAEIDGSQNSRFNRGSNEEIHPNTPKNPDPPQPNKSKGKEASEPEEKSTSIQTNGGPGWLGWLSRTNGQPEQASSSAPPSLRSPNPPLPPEELSSSRSQTLDANIKALPPVPGDPVPTPSRRSWLQMWSGGSAKEEPSTSKEMQDKVDPSDQNADRDLAAVETSANDSSVSDSQILPTKSSAPPTLQEDGAKSSGWVFWSRDRKADDASRTPNEPHVGEIAVSDTPSQKRPRRASINLERPMSANISKEPQTPVVTGRKISKPTDLSALQAKDTGQANSMQNTSEAQKEGTVTPMSAKLPGAEVKASKKLQSAIPNLLLPSFNETFILQETPSLLQLLSRLFNYNRPSEDKHLHKMKEVPRLRSALAIGVHGYFPAPLIRTVLGQPTGTSIKFADMAAKAIRKWTENRGYSCEVKTAALEGEGRIAERVDLLWKLLLNWIDEIRKADFVMVACHSQGVPVALELIAKLIDFGCVNSAKIGVCAMAGVSLGPFPDYKSRWISGSAGELFEFSNSASTVSKDYLTAVETVLRFGVHVLYVGSIDDQLVSLESSTFAPISHPHIYRAVFVDGRIHAPNFLVHLVGFALKLRNLSVQDHGLIRELSGPLAGSLYTGEGHSRIYEDSNVYDLAVEFALETNTIVGAPLSQKPNSTPSSNPYILPWAVRGILEEDFVKSDLRDEANELLRQFDDWKPTTKVLKDVKFRLEGIRSKL